MSTNMTSRPELQELREAYLSLLKEVTTESDFFLGDDVKTSEADRVTFRADDILRKSAELYSTAVAYKATSTKTNQRKEIVNENNKRTSVL